MDRTKGNLIGKIDVEFLPLIAKHHWFLHYGYVVTNAYRGRKRIVLRLHRMVMDAQPGELVDHINGDKTDNRKENLRLCTNAENCRNSFGKRNSGNRIKGVRKIHDCARWEARICRDGKYIYLGTFKLRKQAEHAVVIACNKYHGEFSVYASRKTTNP